ncbi:MAG: phosphatidylinositol mannoside acyltransferase [Acidimicrobiales bacterium]|nr:phosphatidylinositol mannoside acyltransferase [Acidimicrobiales bacterium]
MPAASAKLTVGAYRGASAVAKALPSGIAQNLPRWLGPALARSMSSQAHMLGRHLRRAQPGLDGEALTRAVARGFESYARYYVESFRLPDKTPAELDAGIEVPHFHHVSDALERGNGVILALPHLGGWEWAGFWLTAVKRLPVTVVVEALEPPELFEWFTGLRSEFGMNVVVADSGAGTAVAAALGRNEVVCLLSDRDVMGGGVEVDFFGERTRLPAGPAMLGLRKSAPVLPVGVYFRPGGGHLGLVRPPLPLQRRGSFRDDVSAGTQALAHELEFLIRQAPEQWHLLQPNWPSDQGAGG